MKTFTLILGEINFLESTTDGQNRAIIRKKDKTILFDTAEAAEEEGERLISNGTHLSYLIPEIYSGIIVDGIAETYLNNCRVQRTGRWINKLM